MRAKIGPDEQVNNALDAPENMGREYANYMTVNGVRMRVLEGIPQKNVTQLSLEFDSELFQGNRNGNKNDTKKINFCVIQAEGKVPVFILPSTSTMTSHMNDQKRANHMQQVFGQCYGVYEQNCKKEGSVPVKQNICAATVVAGTKTIWGGDHFTTMIKPPGDEKWQHIDPTSFGGPQRFNRKQCGGYSSMLEAEALMHFSSKSIPQAQQDEQKNKVARSFWGFIKQAHFKFNTWFSGSRNEVTFNAQGKEVTKGRFVTTYAEMADFSSGRLARQFENQEFINTRINKNKSVPIEQPLALQEQEELGDGYELMNIPEAPLAIIEDHDDFEMVDIPELPLAALEDQDDFELINIPDRPSAAKEDQDDFELIDIEEEEKENEEDDYVRIKL